MSHKLSRTALVNICTRIILLEDLDSVAPIDPRMLHARCGWSPFGGHQGVFPELTLAAGAPVYRRRDDARRSGGVI